MAKQLVTWQETDGRLFMNRANALPPETLAVFDLSKIFPDIQKLNDVQKHLTVYGVKQSLADAGSSEKTAPLKVEAARTKWALYLKGEITTRKVGVVSKAKQLDALLAMSPEQALEALKAMQG